MKSVLFSGWLKVEAGEEEWGAWHLVAVEQSVEEDAISHTWLCAKDSRWVYTENIHYRTMSFSPVFLLTFPQDGCYLPNADPNTIIAGLSVTQGNGGEMPLNSTMRWVEKFQSKYSRGSIILSVH